MSARKNTCPYNVGFVLQTGKCICCPSRTCWGQAAQAGDTGHVLSDRVQLDASKRVCGVNRL